MRPDPPSPYRGKEGETVALAVKKEKAGSWVFTK